MLEIHKIKDDEIIKQLASELEIDYNINDMFLGAFVSGELKEYVYYKKSDDGYIIIDISDKSDDFQIILGLVKTMIFYVDLAMLNKLYLPLRFERVAKAVGFKQADSLYELDLLEYHKKCDCM